MAEELHVSSLIVFARPGEMLNVREAVAALPGTEVHAAEAGRMIVTLETAHETEIVHRLNQISVMDGVLSAVLVYHHVEPLAEGGRNQWI